MNLTHLRQGAERAGGPACALVLQLINLAEAAWNLHALHDGGENVSLAGLAPHLRLLDQETKR